MFLDYGELNQMNILSQSIVLFKSIETNGIANQYGETTDKSHDKTHFSAIGVKMSQ